MKRRIWLLYNSLIILIGIIGYGMTYFYIWQGGESYDVIIRYSLMSLLAISVTPLISSVLAKFLRPNIMTGLGVAIEGLSYLMIIQAAPNLDLVAIVATIGFSLKNDNISATTSSYQVIGDIGNSNSVAQGVRSTMAIVAPLVLGQMDAQFGLESSLQFLFIASMFLAGLTITLVGKQTEATTHVISLSLKLFSRPTGRRVVSTMIGNGLLMSFAWGITTILAFEYLGGVTEWSRFASFVALISVFVSYQLGKINASGNLSMLKSMGVISLILVTISILSLVGNFNDWSFVLFLALYNIFTTTTYVASNTYYTKYISQNFPEHRSGDQGVIISVNFYESLGSLFVITILFLQPVPLTAESLIFLILFATIAAFAMLRRLVR